MNTPAYLARFLTGLGYSPTDVAATVAQHHPGCNARALAEQAAEEDRESKRQIEAELDRSAVAAEHDLSKSTNQPPEA